MTEPTCPKCGAEWHNPSPNKYRPIYSSRWRCLSGIIKGETEFVQSSACVIRELTAALAKANERIAEFEAEQKEQYTCCKCQKVNDGYCASATVCGTDVWYWHCSNCDHNTRVN